MEAKSYVSYADFGAKGDGITNDFFAIKRAHDYANENGLAVKAEARKTYLITDMTDENGVCDPISIKTNTDFSGSTFIIDDTHLTWSEDGPLDYFINVFAVESESPIELLDESYIKRLNSYKIENKPLICNHKSETPTKRLDLGLGYPAMLIVYNDNKNMFIRWGYKDPIGAPQREIVVIDKDGNLDPETPFLFNFETVTRIRAVRIDVKPITIENATFISRASKVNLVNQYHSIRRGFSVMRPNTTFKNLNHIITGEIPRNTPVRKNSVGISEIAEGYKYSDGKIYAPDGSEYVGDDIKPFIGHSYSGFLQIHETHNTLIENVAFQSRVFYLQGTYDLLGTMANKLVFKNCTQNNFYDERYPDKKVPNMTLCWGVSGTNYCKNMDFISCKLTRYDAHCGVYNGKIIDSEIAVLRLIGGGQFSIENTVIHNIYRSPIQLRSDYGASFDGDLKIKNVKILDSYKNNSIVALIDAPTAQHDFGYTTYFPNLEIENVDIETDNKIIDLVYYCVPAFNPKYPYLCRNPLSQDVHLINAEFESFKNGVPSGVILKNLNPYTPPEKIAVNACQNKDYKFRLYKSHFFDCTNFEGDGSLILDTPPSVKEN